MFLDRLNRTLLTSAMMLGGLCGSAVAQTATDSKTLSHQILPRDTYFYMSMPSVERVKESLQESSAGRLFADPALDEFKAEVETAFGEEMSEGFAKVQETLGLTVEELLAIPSGEIAMAISKAPPNKMGVILFFGYGDHESQVQELLQKAVAALGDIPDLEAANVEHDGIELTMFNVKAEIAKKTPLAKEFGWFMKDQQLVISNTSALLKLTLDNWDGSSEKTLATNPTFAYIMDKCESEPGSSMMTTFADPVGLFTQLVQTGSLGEAGLGAGMAIGVLPTLGLNQLKGMGSVGEVGGDEFEGVSRTFIYCEQPPEAAMQIFQLDTVDPVPPSWIKEGTSAWMSANWKVNEAYSAVETMVDSFRGAGALAGMIDDAASQGPQIHIKDDIIDQLDGKLHFLMAPADRESEAASDDILMTIGVKDTEKMVEVLNKVSSLPGFPGETRELEGATIYEISPGNGQLISFTVANNQLMIGVGGSQLEQAVRNDDDLRPLSESDDFKAIAEHFEDGAIAVTFTRPAEQYRRLYEMLRDGEAVDSFPGMDEMFSKIDFSKLPPFEVVEKYMAPAGGYWVGDENGVLMKSYSLSVE